MKKILVSGIPGMGKTSVGDYFSDVFKYYHLNLENQSRETMSKLYLQPGKFIDALLKTDQDIVVSWGFIPEDTEIGIIEIFKKKGFKLFWFDGERVQARKEFIRRENERSNPLKRIPVEMFDLQVRNIDAAQVVNRLQPTLYNTFRSDRKFKDLPLIASELLQRLEHF